MDDTDNKPPKKRDTSTTLAIVAAILLTASAILLVSTLFVKELDDGSQKVREMKVRPEISVPPLADLEHTLNYSGKMKHDHPKAHALYNKAKALMEFSQFTEAIVTLKESEAEYKKDLGSKKPNDSDRLNLSGDRSLAAQCQMALGDFHSALKLQHEALDLEPSKHNWELIAEIYRRLNMNSEAKFAKAKAASFPSNTEMMEHLLNSLE